MSQDRDQERQGAFDPGDSGPAGSTQIGIDAAQLSAWLTKLPENDPLLDPPTNEEPWRFDVRGALRAPPAAPVAAEPPASAAAAPAAPPAPLVEAAPPPPVMAPLPIPPAAVPVAAPPAAPAPAAPVAAPPIPAPAAPPLPALRLEVTSARRTVEQLVQGDALIGRPDTTRGLHPTIDLRLDDMVSRRHAQITFRDGCYVLSDLRSTNGTRYNRQELTPHQEVALRAGDEIELGETSLIRVLEAP